MTGFGASGCGHVAGGTALRGNPMKKNVSDQPRRAAHRRGASVASSAIPATAINGIMGALRARQRGRRRRTLRRRSGCAHESSPDSWRDGARQVHWRGRSVSSRRAKDRARSTCSNGLYDAKLDHQPVVAIVGQHAFARRWAAARSRRPTCEASLFGDVASQLPRDAVPRRALRHVVDRAVPGGHSAERTVEQRSSSRTTCRLLPAVPEPEHKQSRPGHSGARLSSRRDSCPGRDEQLRHAAAVLNAGRKVAIIAGAGALHAAGRADRGGRAARRGRGQGAAWKGRRARRPSHS